MFDLNTAEDLFFYIQDSMKKYLANKHKNVSDVFFLIMALNHLREWIAPGYHPRFNDKSKSNEWKETNNGAEIFSKKIYEEKSFIKLRQICNGTKHLSKKAPQTSSSHELQIDDWSEVDSVKEFDKGPHSGFFVEDMPLENILTSVLSYYENEWFSKIKR